MAGKLIYRGDEIYTFTLEDRDTLIRAIRGEAGKDACSSREGMAVACCMISRWAMFLTLPWYRKLLLKKPDAKIYGYDSFDDLLHAYSQPVNFAWLNGGRFDKDPAHESPEEKRRADFLSAPVDSFPIPIIAMVDSILCFAPGDSGRLRDGVPKDMAGLVHFFCPAIYHARKLTRLFGREIKPRDLTNEQVRQACREHTGNPDKNLIFAQPDNVSMRSNSFYRLPRTRGWKPDFVRIVPA